MFTKKLSGHPHGGSCRSKIQPSSAEQHPAPGYRHPSYGTLYSVGVYGFSWSSTASGSNAHNLGFSYGGVGPQSYSNRAYGFPLRCIQE